MRTRNLPVTRLLTTNSRSFHQLTNKPNTKPQSFGLPRKFALYTPQIQNQMTQRTYITGEMIMAFSGMLVGAGAIGGGVIALIGRYIYEKTKARHQQQKELKEQLDKANAETKTLVEALKKQHEEFQKYKQEKEDI